MGPLITDERCRGIRFELLLKVITAVLIGAGLRGGWVFDSGLEIDAGVENIADELYAYEEGFYEPGRRYNFGLTYRF